MVISVDGPWGQVVGGLEGTFHLFSVELDNYLLEIVNIYSPGLSHLNLTFNNIILLLRLLTSLQVL